VKGGGRLGSLFPPLKTDELITTNPPRHKSSDGDAGAGPCERSTTLLQHASRRRVANRSR